MDTIDSKSPVESVVNNNDQSDNSTSSPNKILTLAFNQDGTALAMGLMKNYSLFSINQNIDMNESNNCAYEEVRLIERLFSSSLVVLVTNKAPKKLILCHIKKGVEIHSNVFPTDILNIKLNRSRLVVRLDESIWIYDIRNMKVLHTIRDVPPNPDGLCALSSNDTCSDLAYPKSALTGEIQMFDTVNLRPGLPINAHEGPLAAMAFDMTGTKLATASIKGTVIRIHNTIDGSCLFEFRRGVRRFATIYSLAFSPDSMFLAASSNTGTVHIFRLTKQTQNTQEEANTWMGSFNRILDDVAYYLPKQTSGVLTQDRSFATVHLPTGETKTTVTMNIINKKLKLFVGCYDGFVYIYEVNTNDGGECKQIGQYLLFNMSETSSNQESNNRQILNSEGGEIYPPSVFRTSDSNNRLISSTHTNKETS